MHGNWQLGTSQLLERLAIEIDERFEPLRVAADDRERERQAIARGADDGLGTAADADPGAQGAVLDRWINDLSLQGRTRRSARRTAPDMRCASGRFGG